MPYRIELIAIAAGIALAQPAPKPAVLRPHDGATVAVGAASIVARASDKAEFRLDGKPLAAKLVGPGAWTAVVQWAAGPHRVELIDGGSTIAIGVTAVAGASFRAHPPSATCETCHAVRENAWAFKTEPLSDTCFGCHDAKAFAPKHEHNAEVLYECGLCHNPHGSSAAKHLKMKREIACKQCHG